MSKKTTVYEDREERRRKYEQEHMVQCPHCGKPVLDHMTKCSHCGGKLEPRGYTPLTDKQIKKIKRITFSVGMVIAVAVLLLYFLVLKK